MLLTAGSDFTLCYNQKVGIRTLLIAILLLALAGPGAAADWRIEGGSSAWSLAPFNSLLEKKAKGLVRAEAERLVGDLFPGLGLSTSALTVASDSSGFSFSLACWRRLSDAWSLGIRLEWVDYRIPMQVASQHRVLVFGQPLFPVETAGLAELRIKTLLPAMGLRGEKGLGKKIRISGLVGIAYLPLTGRLDYRTEAFFPVFDEFSVTVPLVVDSSLAELRREFSSLPAGILFPFLESRLEYGISRNAGLFLGLALGSGINAGGGIFIIF